MTCCDVTHRPDTEPTIDVRGEGAALRRARRLQGRCRVLVDGDDLTGTVVAAREGDDGWVEVYLPDDDGSNRALCDNPACPVERGSHAAIAWRPGRVEVTPT